MNNKTIKSGSLTRSFAIQERAALDNGSRVVQLAFASNEPVETYIRAIRDFGYEILDVSPTSIDLTRLLRSGPLLLEHDPEQQIGVVESVDIGSDGVVRASVRFGRGALADEVFKDVIDGIRNCVSFGYRVLELVLEKQGLDGELSTYRATKWEPFEISIVSIPADTTVGVGRALSDEVREIQVVDATQTVDESARSEDEEEKETTEDTQARMDSEETPTEDNAERASPLILSERGLQMDKDLRKDVSEILAIGQRFGKMAEAQAAIESGKTANEFRAAVLDSLSTTNPSLLGTPKQSDIGMTDKEARNFSLIRAVRAAADGNWKDAGLEREASEAVSKLTGIESRGFYVPYDVMRRSMNKGLTADGSDGGKLVATILDSGNFIEVLRNKILARQAGATVLSGLVGDLAIPRQNSQGNAYWISEGDDATESSAKIDQVPLTPKTVGAYTDLTRKFLLQSSIDAEMFAWNEILNNIALEMDRVVYSGSGQGAEPLGILNHPDVKLLSLGANGAALKFADIVALETAVAETNADIGSLAYMTNATVRGKLKTTEKAAGYPVYLWGEGNTPLNGYAAYATNQLPKNLEKGTGTNLSPMIFGNWSDVIIGMWGALDMAVDKASLSKSGGVRITAFQDCDVALRRGQSFAAYKDIKVA